MERNTWGRWDQDGYGGRKRTCNSFPRAPGNTLSTTESNTKSTNRCVAWSTASLKITSRRAKTGGAERAKVRTLLSAGWRPGKKGTRSAARRKAWKNAYVGENLGEDVLHSSCCVVRRGAEDGEMYEYVGENWKSIIKNNVLRRFKRSDENYEDYFGPPPYQKKPRPCPMTLCAGSYREHLVLDRDLCQKTVPTWPYPATNGQTDRSSFRPIPISLCPEKKTFRPMSPVRPPCRDPRNGCSGERREKNHDVHQYNVGKNTE